ncbi:TPA: chorismate-binding protein [Escherichia coli]
MKISEFLHLALPEEQWLPTISGVLRQFAEEECYVYERQPCWYLGKGCQARLHDSKEVLEHILSVKEAIAELEAVCQPGSVVVEDLMSVRQRGSVQHLGSGVSGQLAENKDAWDAFTVLFPSITASGIPKNAALNAIMQIEKTPRELYSGAILLLDDTRFDAALVLRSVFQDSQRCWIQAGAGIIAQSTPERELTETREKLASIAPYLMV